MSRGQGPYGHAADLLAELPTALRVARRMRGVSVRDVGAATGVGLSTISQLENGRKACSLSNAVRLLRWLDQTTEVPADV